MKQILLLFFLKYFKDIFHCTGTILPTPEVWDHLWMDLVSSVNLYEQQSLFSSSLRTHQALASLLLLVLGHKLPNSILGLFRWLSFLGWEIFPCSSQAWFLLLCVYGGPFTLGVNSKKPLIYHLKSIQAIPYFIALFYFTISPEHGLMLSSLELNCVKQESYLS